MPEKMLRDYSVRNLPSTLYYILTYSSVQPLDGTHSWVNGEHLLRTCLIGTLVPDPITPNSQTDEKGDEEGEKKSNTEEKEDEIDPADMAFPAVDSPQRAQPREDN